MILHREDLAKLVKSEMTLTKYINEKGFPAGRIIANRRVWTEREVLAWVEKQPQEKSAKSVSGGLARMKAHPPLARRRTEAVEAAE
jgi:predicted DNA-binding transcriptional regulator AlpA